MAGLTRFIALGLSTGRSKSSSGGQNRKTGATNFCGPFVWYGDGLQMIPLISENQVVPADIIEFRKATMEFLWFILIGIVAGWLAGQIMKGGGYGLIGDLILGVVGALLGGFLFGLFGISTPTLIGSLITATIGAIILIALLRLVKRA